MVSFTRMEVPSDSVTGPFGVQLGSICRLLNLIPPIFKGRALADFVAEWTDPTPEEPREEETESPRDTMLPEDATREDKLAYRYLMWKDTERLRIETEALAKRKEAVDASSA